MADSIRSYQGYGGVFSLPPGKALDICIALQSAILEHRFAPGTKLTEDEVGDLFGASRTIVRVALQALAHSELVTIERNRGAFVSQPTIREAHEVFEARALIEPRVAATAAKCISKRDLESLQTHLKSEHEALRLNNKGAALALSGLFHIAIAEIADQQVFTAVVRSLISRSSLIIALYWKRPDTTCERHSHEALINAFENQDAEQASEIMQSHIVDLLSGLDLVEKPNEKVSLAELFSR